MTDQMTDAARRNPEPLWPLFAAGALRRFGLCLVYVASGAAIALIVKGLT